MGSGKSDGKDFEDLYDKFHPAEWPLSVWHAIFWVFAILVIIYNKAPLTAFVTLSIVWVIIFGSIYLYRFIKGIYMREANQKALAEERIKEESHKLSNDEMMKWDNLKNKLQE